MNDNFTIVIQIGNTDDKLSQNQWSKFVKRTQEIVKVWAMVEHFSGGSSSTAPWQNACFVLTLKRDFYNQLVDELSKLAERFNQDCIAITQGETMMISKESFKTMREKKHD